VKILVTGATGFIGRPVVERLLASGAEVHAVGRSVPPVQSEGTLWHRGDFLDVAQMTRLFAQVRPSHWMHLAWITESPAYWTAQANFDWLRASLPSLEAFAAHGGQRVVGAGTCAEYDWSGGWCHEASTPCRPATLYGAAKHALGLMQQAWCRQSGLSQAWGRVFHLYGPGEGTGRFVPSVIRALLAGEPARCTRGLQQRDLLHVDDVAAGLVALLASDHEGAANIASAAPVALAEVAQLIGEITGRGELLQLGALPDRPNDPPLLAGGNGVLTRLGWQPTLTLRDGLARLARFRASL